MANAAGKTPENKAARLNKVDRKWEYIGYSLAAYFALLFLFTAVSAVAYWLMSRSNPDMVNPGLVEPFSLITGTSGPNDVPKMVNLIAVAFAGVVGYFVWDRRRLKKKIQAVSVAAKTGELEDRPWHTTTIEVEREAGTARLLNMAPVISPKRSTDGQYLDTFDVGYYLGTAWQKPVWATIERSMLLIGPPGSGKGQYFVLRMACEHRGSLITTTTKPEDIKQTIDRRRALGPVYVFDPLGLVSASLTVKRAAWDIVDGCLDKKRAEARARGLMASSGIDASGKNAEWLKWATTVVKCCLHAADVLRKETGTTDGSTMEDVLIWLSDASGGGLEDPADILRQYANHGSCKKGQVCNFAIRLEAIMGQEPKFVQSVMSVIDNGLSALDDQTVLASLCPPVAGSAPSSLAELAINPTEAFNAETFLQPGRPATLYAVANSNDADVSGFVAAFIEDMAATAYKTAAANGGRLEPGLMFLLDECANVCKTIPALPGMLAEGRSRNVTAIAVFQSKKQLKSTYGDKAEEMFDSATVKVILKGLSNSDDLEDISRQIGSYDEIRESESYRQKYFGDDDTSVSRSVTSVPIMPANAIQSIPKGTALVFHLDVGDWFPIRLKDFFAAPEPVRLEPLPTAPKSRSRKVADWLSTSGSRK